jgi:hypothetical protein
LKCRIKTVYLIKTMAGLSRLLQKIKAVKCTKLYWSIPSGR